LYNRLSEILKQIEVLNSNEVEHELGRLDISPAEETFPDIGSSSKLTIKRAMMEARFVSDDFSFLGLTCPAVTDVRSNDRFGWVDIL
jgi:hypothetical protein